MKKKTINAFTLVEMLIVIVIIGILIAALMPRMQAAQGRARDVSRKTALSQIQSAIVTSQGDKGQWPGVCGGDTDIECDTVAENGSTCNISATEGVDVECIRKELTAAGMNSVPTDPLAATEVEGLGDTGYMGQYRYMVTTRNGAEEGGFILMAKTEVEGGSNFVVCSDTSITSGTDIADPEQFQLCTSITKSDDENECIDAMDEDGGGACTYGKDSQLRYVVVY